MTLDEAFSLSEETGNMILDGFVPTMATRLQATGVQPQLWITSTEGTADSTFSTGNLTNAERATSRGVPVGLTSGCRPTLTPRP